MRGFASWFRVLVFQALAVRSGYARFQAPKKAAPSSQRSARPVGTPTGLRQLCEDWKAVADGRPPLRGVESRRQLSSQKLCEEEENFGAAAAGSRVAETRPDDLLARTLALVEAADVSNRFVLGDLSALAHAIAKAKHTWQGTARDRMHKVLAVIDAGAATCARDLDPRQLATMAWAFAKAGYVPGTFFDAIAGNVKRIDEFNSRELANTAWAFATLRQKNPAVFDAIAKRGNETIDAFNSQELANTAWALATVGHEARLFFDAIAGAARERIGTLDARGLSNTAWALATVGHEDRLFFDAIAGAARERIGTFNAQALSNTVWAFATAGHEDRLLFDAIAGVAREHIGTFNAQNLSNTTWAFAKVGHHDGLFFDAIAGAARERIGTFNAQALSNTAWAFATVGHEDRLFFDAIAGVARERIGTFNAQSLSNMTWAFATVGHHDRFFFDAIAGAARECICTFTAQNLSNTAWAFARLRDCASLSDCELRFLHAMATQILSMASEIDFLGLSALRSSFDKLQLEERHLLNEMVYAKALKVCTKLSDVECEWLTREERALCREGLKTHHPLVRCSLWGDSWRAALARAKSAGCQTLSVGSNVTSCMSGVACVKDECRVDEKRAMEKLNLELEIQSNETWLHPERIALLRLLQWGLLRAESVVSLCVETLYVDVARESYFMYRIPPCEDCVKWLDRFAARYKVTIRHIDDVGGVFRTSRWTTNTVFMRAVSILEVFRAS